MMPKLPFIRRVFFAFTKGKNRALSLAEGLGRLYFCGFEVLDLKDIDNKVYFVAKKIGEPLMDKNPSYSPIFKMRRNGRDGKTIFVYKLRTMHPYSEYLQDFVYEQNKLEEGGKFKDDFRITTWGSLFRKLWIDELPMLINWFKGDCKLVGVRPLSSQYLSLYDEEFKKRRFKYKPGLVPPFYADMPKNISEIIKSEEKYLDEYDKKGRLADFKYMLKALKNIVIHKQRSN
jgi:lipopolysaccharide/colanic/teichoic acid biosynthesis glycosyltransferase